MNWSRRDFVKTTSFVLAGGIFVPRYERWFPLVRPIGELYEIDLIQLSTGLENFTSFKATLRRVSPGTMVTENGWEHEATINKVLEIEGVGSPEILQLGNKVRVNMGKLISKGELDGRPAGIQRADLTREFIGVSPIRSLPHIKYGVIENLLLLDRTLPISAPLNRRGTLKCLLVPKNFRA